LSALEGANTGRVLEPSAGVLQRVPSLVTRLVAALCDPQRRGQAAMLVALGYAVVWTLYAVIAKSSQDLNGDMAEMVIWSRQPAFGYPRHPPFLAWLVAAWFRIFPSDDWAFLLLAVGNLALGLWLAFVLAGEWLDGAKRAAVPLLLAVIPFYNFLGLKFDQNSALITLWALTMLGFVRSLDTGSLGWAAVAGLAAAAALLSKYWSAFLLLALLVAALADQHRLAYFRSGAPYLTALMTAGAFAPHFLWLVQNDFESLRWANSRYTGALANWLNGLVEYSFGTIGYAGVALLLFWLAAWPSRAAWRDIAVPEPGPRRRAALMFWVPIVVPIMFAAVTRTKMLSLWNTPALTLLPVILLSSPLVNVTREAVARIAASAIAVSLAALLASPVAAYMILKAGVESNLAYSRMVMADMQTRWRTITDKPLTLVGGPFSLASSAAFYGPDRPLTFIPPPPRIAPWTTPDRIARQGMMMVCPSDDSICGTSMAEQIAANPGAKRAQIELRRRWLMFEGPPARFDIATLPPRAPAGASGR
jgi:4-amino-4-deoxy-L-arabinose transferase-like glycosyltransferase